MLPVSLPSPAWPCRPCCGPGPSLSGGLSGVCTSPRTSDPPRRGPVGADQPPLHRCISHPPAPRTPLTSPCFTPTPGAHPLLALAYSWTLEGCEASAPQAPTAGGRWRAGGSYRAKTERSCCRPVRNTLTFVTATKPVQLKTVTCVSQVSILAKRVDCHFHKRCCFLNAASFSQPSSFEATPTLDGLEVFRGDINPHSGLEGLRPGPLSSSRAGVVTTPALGFCLGLARQAKLLRKREVERPSLSCNSRLESIYKLPVGWGED